MRKVESNYEKHLMIRFFTLSILFCFTLPSHAQFSMYPFENIGKADGLSQVTINDIYQDRYGFLWFATQEGLNRYDGYEFKVYKNNPFDSASLSHSWVWHIQEDTLGYLWLGCWIGLSRYDPRTGQFEQFNYDPTDPNSLAGSRVNYLEKDQEGRIWISCWGAGLSLLEDSGGKFQTIPVAGNTMDTIKYIRCLAGSEDGGLWIGSWGQGIWKIEDAGPGHFIGIPLLPDHPVLGTARITTLIEQDGKLFIATEGDGSWIYRIKEKEIVNVNDYVRHESRLPANIYRIALYQDYLLLGSEIDGLWSIDMNHGSVQQYLHDPQDPGSLNGNTIYSIFVDNHNILWLGTQGINKIDPGKIKFSWFHHIRNDPSSLSQDNVSAFCEDEQNQIWIGKGDPLLTRFDPDSKSMVHFHLRHRDHTVKIITSITRQGSWLWMGTEGTGIVKFNLKDYTTDFLIDHSRVMDHFTRITSLMWIHPDTLVVGTDGQGLIKYIPNMDSAIVYRFNRNDPHSIGYDVVNCLLKDSHGRLWLGTWGGGLNLYDGEKDRFDRYYYQTNQANTLSSDIVYDILEDPVGNLWVATGNGLNYYDLKNQIFHHFYESDGLPGNIINKILQDSLGNLWVSTNYGVSQFNLRDSVFINYTPSEGLQGFEFNSGVGAASTRGLFYFGGTRGFNEFDPVSIQHRKPDGPMVFTSIQVFQEPLKGIDYNDPRLSLNLPYHRNFLSFEYAALNFAGEKSNHFAYRMTGLDEGWVYTEDRRFANYTDIDPGRYVFEVALVLGNNVVEETVKSIPIQINPPFWHTRWFIALIVILFFMLLFALHRYRLSQVIAMANLRNKIATDLHDDVGSSLTKISLYSGLLKGTLDPANSRTYLEKISNLSREVIGTMSDIVWSIDTRNDAWYHLIDRMREYVLEFGSLKNVEVDFKFDHIPENKKMDQVLRQNLYLIFKEAVNNAIKYAEASMIEVHLDLSDHTLELKITDNGKGFDPSHVKGNGLFNMQKRAKRIQGSLSISAQEGTKIQLQVPIYS